MITLRRHGAIWLDEDDVRYDWLEDCECFIDSEEYLYYTVKERPDDDHSIVELAQTPHVIGMYAEDYDITFIMEYELSNGLIMASEVVSWYHGRPSKELIEEWSENRQLRAIFC